MTPTFTVDLEAIAANYRAIAHLVSPAAVWAVVKGDAYGLGAIPVGKRLAAAGADRFVVRNMQEAERLRRAGISGRILALAIDVGEEFDRALHLCLEVNVEHGEQLHHVIERSRAFGRRADVHLHIDTGLARGGFVLDEAAAAIRAASAAPSLRVRGIWTHLADAGDAERSRRELSAFVAAAAEGPATAERHVAASRALLHGHRFFLDAVRPGLALYGLHPLFTSQLAVRWVAPLHLVCRRPAGFRVGYGAGIALERNSWLGVVPVGFADGYPPVASGAAAVRNRLVPILSVAMTALVVDLTDAGPCAVGDEVVLLGDPAATIAAVVEACSPAVVPGTFTCLHGPGRIRAYVGDGSALSPLAPVAS